MAPAPLGPLSPGFVRIDGTFCGAVTTSTSHFEVTLDIAQAVVAANALRPALEAFVASSEDRAAQTWRDLLQHLGCGDPIAASTVQAGGHLVEERAPSSNDVTALLPPSQTCERLPASPCAPHAAAQTERAEALPPTMTVIAGAGACSSSAAPASVSSPPRRLARTPSPPPLRAATASACADGDATASHREPRKPRPSLWAKPVLRSEALHAVSAAKAAATSKRIRSKDSQQDQPQLTPLERQLELQKQQHSQECHLQEQLREQQELLREQEEHLLEQQEQMQDQQRLLQLRENQLQEKQQQLLQLRDELGRLKHLPPAPPASTAAAATAEALVPDAPNNAEVCRPLMASEAASLEAPAATSAGASPDASAPGAEASWRRTASEAASPEAQATASPDASAQAAPCAEACRRPTASEASGRPTACEEVSQEASALTASSTEASATADARREASARLEASAESPSRSLPTAEAPPCTLTTQPLQVQSSAAAPCADQAATLLAASKEVQWLTSRAKTYAEHSDRTQREVVRLRKQVTLLSEVLRRAEVTVVELGFQLRRSGLAGTAMPEKAVKELKALDKAVHRLHMLKVS
eukprot:TRINITY_DN39105_c0_g1_i1.p1 TRINITY_DN39105_c0_g1~~TRINITY_DN39105_c0_g1_i1.p1  ORF type:complete len:588 (+),score=157.98 TRINITY_DN39105_c0_g1_i1:31-1794(+)